MKQAIRATLLSRRRAQNLPEKMQKDAAILQRLLNAPAFKKATTIMLYLPIHGEADVSKLFEQNLNKKLVLPRVNCTKRRQLSLHLVKSLAEETRQNSYGLTQPKSTMPRTKKVDIDLVLVPGVAFAKDGHRIGYGHGFYDRFLKNLRCPKIGIAYAFQIMKNITGEEHDQKVDAIITEKETIHCPKFHP